MTQLIYNLQKSMEMPTWLCYAMNGQLYTLLMPGVQPHYTRRAHRDAVRFLLPRGCLAILQHTASQLHRDRGNTVAQNTTKSHALDDIGLEEQWQNLLCINNRLPQFNKAPLNLHLIHTRTRTNTFVHVPGSHSYMYTYPHRIHVHLPAPHSQMNMYQHHIYMQTHKNTSFIFVYVRTSFFFS